MADVFHEVDEQIRSAQFQRVVRRGWPYAAGLLVALAMVALVAWALNQRELADAGKASDIYAQGVRALAAGDLQGASARFADIAHSGPRAYRALALMQEAGIEMKRSDAAGAVSTLDQAAQFAPNDLMGDAARLEAAFVVMDGGDYRQIRSRLTPLIAAGRPYRTMAREALGMAELASGRVAAARGDLQLVSLASDASDIAHNRAGAALALIQSGGWSNLTALAQASASLKPQPPSPAGSPVAASPGGTADAQPSTAASAGGAP